MSTPLLPSHVAAILARLNPLDDIPPTLLSTPLRQRHHFLAISPYASDPAAYLAWPPSSSQEKDTLDSLLAALPGPEDADPFQTYPTVYTHDGETSYAHASVPVHEFASAAGNANAGLRLVFRWEGTPDSENTADDIKRDEHPWKYHDAKPMPFPQGASSSPTIDSALSNPASPTSPASCSTAGSLPTQEGATALDLNPTSSHFNSITITGMSEDGQGTESEDDDYWNSYGRETDDEGDNNSKSRADLDDEKAEEAYWARYNSVQGTADSTIPSPVSAKHKLLEPFSHSETAPTDTSHPMAEEFDPSSEYAARADYLARLFLMQREGEQLGPHDLSPHALELRLHSISPRPPPPSSAINSMVTTPAPDANFGTNNMNEGNSGSTDDERISSPDDVASFGSDESLTLSPPSTESQRRQRENIVATEPEIHSPRPRRSHEHISALDRENVSSLDLQLNEGWDALVGTSGSRSNAGVGGTGKALADPADAAVRDALKGVYRLWTATQREGTQKAAFVDIVRDVLEGL